MQDDQKPRTRQSDTLDPARAQAMEATLGLTPALTTGDALPPFYHQLYFWTPLPPSQLGRDGHPARGQGVIPDLGLPRRMWAGGRLRFMAPLTLGTDAICTTTLVSSVRKTGRSGPLGLVTLGIDITQNGQTCLHEERDLIYREEADPNAPPRTPPLAPTTAKTRVPLSFTTTQLFRYSALTFNGHRIHYDLDYAKTVEGYAGLVVHGPLLAQHLINLATETLGPLRSFDFRATAPLMDWEQATACCEDTRFWIEGPDGRLCMTADAVA